MADLPEAERTLCPGLSGLSSKEANSQGRRTVFPVEEPPMKQAPRGSGSKIRTSLTSQIVCIVGNNREPVFVTASCLGFSAPSSAFFPCVDVFCVS